MYKKNGRNNEIFMMVLFYNNIHNVTKDGQDYRIFKIYRLECFDRITGFSRFTGLNVLTGLQDFQDLQV